MTKQELIKMTGNEEQANFAMLVIMESMDGKTVRKIFQDKIRNIDAQLDQLKEEGYVYEANGSYEVNWIAPSDNEDVSPDVHEKKQMEAQGLIYDRNRTVSLLAVR